VISVLAVSALTWAGRSLREGFFMFWETLWPLVLGFGLSGAVQAFVPREQMERVMGNHRPAAVARASGLGMVSSSCSYAATAMAKSLFQKGADFVTAMVFMFASTNLVVELGIVLVILMGWQFAAAEFIGGPIMIILLALLGGIIVHRRLTDPARERLARGRAAGDHDHQAMVGVSEQRQADLEAQPWSQKLTSKTAWADAASYTMADLTMLRRELVIVYVVAGLLTVLVPNHVWNAVFVHGHGVWTSIENVVVGPFIAVISFVCSVGNVPLAAALWKGGISFGGVISFVFADLITFPLLLIYRKYYGTALTVRLLVLFWAVMAAAGLIVQGLFSVTGLIPRIVLRPSWPPSSSGTTRRTSTSSFSRCSSCSTGCTATRSAWAADGATPTILCVVCRSAPPMPRPEPPWTAKCSGFAPTAASPALGPVPRSRRPTEATQTLSPTPSHLAPAVTPDQICTRRPLSPERRQESDAPSR
jgi:uncharacterized protein